MDALPSGVLGRVDLSFTVPASDPDAPPPAFAHLPERARAEIERRALDPLWCERRYGARWDGERIVWPAGAGFVRRAVHPWGDPKTLSVAPRGLIGEHLLQNGQHLVITEGDFKAVSIPLPWVGLGILGKALSDEQADAIKNAQPREVLIALDGGTTYEAWRVATQLSPIPFRIIELPPGKGPDDIPRRDLVALLRGKTHGPD